MSPLTVLIPGGNDCGVGLLRWSATPIYPPSPGRCCCNCDFQCASSVHVPLFLTDAIQCTVPSGLQEIVRLVIRKQTAQPSGVDVEVLVGVPVLNGVLVDVYVEAKVGVLVKAGV
jgi:hypothetical protein